MSYILIRGRWCDIIVLNVHAPTEGRNDTKDGFCEELESVFEQCLKYHKTILLGDFNTKVGREDIFPPTIGNESLCEST
jgi:exonuclease III